MSAPEEAIIEFDIELSAKASEDIRAALEEAKKAKGEKETAAEPGAPEEEAKTPAELVEDKELDEVLTTIKKGDITQFGQLAKSPDAFIGNSVTKLFGGSAILGPLALAVATPVVLAEILKALSVKGGPFNRDWRRFIDREIDIGLTREQQKLKELGFEQVILTQIVGFRPNNEGWTFNSLIDINASRLARIGLSDRAAGLTV